MIIINAVNKINYKPTTMNKLLSLKYVIMCFAVTGAFMFQSCKNDEDYDIVGSTENTVYINTQIWSPIDAPKNSFKFDVLNTPVGSSVTNAGSIEVKFPVRCTHAASEDVLVKFEIDKSLIPEGYSELPADLAYAMDKTSLTIAKGSTVSADSITLTIASEELDEFGLGLFMLPVKISTVNNAVVSSSLNAAYLIVSSTFSNCVNNATTVTGAVVTDKSAWSASADGNALGTDLFDNSGGTYYYSGNFILEVDLGSVYENITGLRMNFFSRNYAMGSARIYTSTTTTDDYTYQGSPSFPRNSAQYVSFYEAVDARYVKIVITSPSYSPDYGTAMTEFSIYQ